MIDLNKVYKADCVFQMQYLKDVNYCIVTDPPYNVGYHYKEYSDDMPEDDYYSMMSNVIKDKPCVILHYPESLHKLSVKLNRTPERIVSWVYNSNTARQHRDIAFYGIKPDFSKVSQPYKNPTDKRIQQRIAQGKTCKMYDWFECDQIKNVEKEKMNIDHPCVIPIDVMDKVIKLIPENFVIVDPFCGTGTTLIAAKKNKRNFIGFEKTSYYADIAERRLEEETAQQELF